MPKYKLHRMEADDIFKKYVFDTTNNVQMVDAIMNLHRTAGTAPDGNDLFAKSIYEMIPSIDLCQAICNIRDLVFDLGNTLEIDASYNDATVQDHPTERLDCICGVIPLKPQENQLANAITSMKQSYHDRVFNPMTTEFRPKSQYERLEQEIFNHR